MLRVSPPGQAGAVVSFPIDLARSGIARCSFEAEKAENEATEMERIIASAAPEPVVALALVSLQHNRALASAHRNTVGKLRALLTEWGES